MYTRILLLKLFLVLLAAPLLAQNLTPKEIIQKAESKWQGSSSSAEMTMTIVRPTWQRSIEMKTWSLGYEYSLTLITAPAAEKGQSFLKRNTEMWSWSPKIARMVKLPSAMMSQGWMGSDFTNDDMLRESSIVRDFDHVLLGEEEIQGLPCYKIQLTPKPDAAVVWGRIESWISKGKFDQLKTLFYDEELLLVKTHLMSDIKRMDDREIPTRIEILPADQPKQKTIVTIQAQRFNVKLDQSFFSKQNMQNVK